jgi:hypothetical protein
MIPMAPPEALKLDIECGYWIVNRLQDNDAFSTDSRLKTQAPHEDRGAWLFPAFEWRWDTYPEFALFLALARSSSAFFLFPATTRADAEASPTLFLLQCSYHFPPLYTACCRARFASRY